MKKNCLKIILFSFHTIILTYFCAFVVRGISAFFNGLQVLAKKVLKIFKKGVDVLPHSMLKYGYNERAERHKGD